MALICPPFLDSFHTCGDGVLASQQTIPTLLGKSNFEKWYLSIEPALSSEPQANALISGTWSEPPSPSSIDTFPTNSLSSRSAHPPTGSHPANDTPESKLFTLLHAPSLSRAAFDFHHSSVREYEQANLNVSRFIRSSLAINVIPFVRQYASAQALFEQLIYLYGESAGIDMVGGPAVFGAIDVAFQERRWERPTPQPKIKISRSGSDPNRSTTSAPPSKKQGTEPLQENESRLLAAPQQSRRHTSESDLGYGVSVAATLNHYGQHRGLSPVPDKKKNVAFTLRNRFRRTTSQDENPTPPHPDTPISKHHPRSRSRWTESLGSTPSTPSSPPPTFNDTQHKPSTSSAPSTDSASSFKNFDFSYTARRGINLTQADGEIPVEMKCMMVGPGEETTIVDERGLTAMQERSRLE